MELVRFGVLEYLPFLEGNQGDRHVQQVVLIFFVHEEVEDFVDEGNLHVPELPQRYLAKTVRIYCVTTIDKGISWFLRVS